MPTPRDHIHMAMMRSRKQGASQAKKPSFADFVKKPPKISEDDPRWKWRTMGNKRRGGNPGVWGTAATNKYK